MLDYLRFLTEHRPGAHRWVYIGIVVLLLIPVLLSFDRLELIELFGVLILLPLLQAIRPTLLGWFLLWFPCLLITIMVIVAWLPMTIPATLSFIDIVINICLAFLPIIVISAGYPRGKLVIGRR
jgi:hypothetical protein